MRLLESHWNATDILEKRKEKVIHCVYIRNDREQDVHRVRLKKISKA